METRWVGFSQEERDGWRNVDELIRVYFVVRSPGGNPRREEIRDELAEVIGLRGFVWGEQDVYGYCEGFVKLVPDAKDVGNHTPWFDSGGEDCSDHVAY